MSSTRSFKSQTFICLLPKKQLARISLGEMAAKAFYRINGTELVVISLLRTLVAVLSHYSNIDVSTDVIFRDIINALCITIWILYILNAILAICSFCYLWRRLSTRRRWISLGCAPVWLPLSTFIAQKLLFGESNQTPMQYCIVTGLAVLWGLPVLLGCTCVGVENRNQRHHQNISNMFVSNLVHLALYSIFLVYTNLKILRGCPIGGLTIPFIPCFLLMCYLFSRLVEDDKSIVKLGEPEELQHPHQAVDDGANSKLVTGIEMQHLQRQHDILGTVVISSPAMINRMIGEENALVIT